MRCVRCIAVGYVVLIINLTDPCEDHPNRPT